MYIYKVHSYHFLNKNLIFLNKNTRILSFSMEYFITKIDIIRYYLLPNSTALKFINQEYEYLTVPK